MNRKYIAVLILIMAVAAFFRFWHFASIPPGLYQDEAMNGADALASLHSGSFKIFYENNNGREGMIIWLDALAIKLFGAHPWVLRLFPALAGLSAVLGIYFLAAELFGVETALISSFLAATGFWAVNFSRIGFRAGLMLFFLVWSFYFLVRGFKMSLSGDYAKAIWNFVPAGILFGSGIYTYIAYRFAPVLAIFAFGPTIFKNRADKKLWLGVLIFILAAFFAALPAGIYFLRHPADFSGRASGLFVLSSPSPVLATLASVAETLGMFNFFGDFNWRQNYAGSPELFWPIGLAFLLGLYLCLKKFDFKGRLLIFWLAIFLLPGILTNEGNPHALRTLGAMPAAMMIAGVGLFWFYKKIQKIAAGSKNPRLKKEFFWLFIAFLIFVGGWNFNEYFNLWAADPNTASAFSSDQVAIADYLNGLPPQTKKYAIWSADDRATDNGLPVSAQTVYFLTADKTRVDYLKSDELDKIIPAGEGTIVVPIYFDLNLIHNLNRRFPRSKTEFIYHNAPVVIIPKL